MYPYDDNVRGVYKGGLTIGSPLAVYGNGLVWRGAFPMGTPAASYRDGYIWDLPLFDNSGSCVARYENGYFWLGTANYGDADARYRDGYIWLGFSDMGIPDGSYDGDDDGAAAAIFAIYNDLRC